MALPRQFRHQRERRLLRSAVPPPRNQLARAPGGGSNFALPTNVLKWSSLLAWRSLPLSGLIRRVKVGHPQELLALGRADTAGGPSPAPGGAVILRLASSFPADATGQPQLDLTGYSFAPACLYSQLCALFTVVNVPARPFIPHARPSSCSRSHLVSHFILPL
ncbi:hypothetical protein MN608_08098 [Microdochium nivale]|nr:hypothetical protein MN608_08098 [Microdochium nivale]